MSFMDDFGHLKIQLKDIKLATNDFGDKPIGVGGFGKVYKGELSLPEGKKMMAFKRLDPKHGQGDTEFWKEIMMLSQYKHDNLISLLHFCNDAGERILVYEYAPRGSLDRYLADTSSLTWIQRLKVCHGAASGLNYLHDPVNMNQRVLHRDVKSSNILLDEHFTAKISDFGLSKLGPANQKYTYMVSNTVGTPGYCDPMYMEMGSLSKESDVYSFGVVLFEVMCGRLCVESYTTTEYKILVPMWRQCYEENRLDDIVCKDLKEHIDGDSLITFSSIAYRCLHRDRNHRPTFAEIINELEIALDHQETSQDVDERAKFEESKSIANQATPPVSWRSRKELALVLSNGILLNGSNHWVSVNKNRVYCEMISGTQFLHSDPQHDTHSLVTGRFPSDKVFPCISLGSNFHIEASPRFLSPHITYSINLVYKYCNRDKGEHVPLRYKLHTETEFWTSCVAKRRGEWLSIELYQFTSHQKEHDFRLEFFAQLHHANVASIHMVHVIGIEFLPVEYEKDENMEEDNKQPVVNWEQTLSSDYADITKLSKYDMQWTTIKELYNLLHKGFLLINKNGEQWFSVSKSMKKRLMLPATTVLREGPIWKSLFTSKNWTWKYLPESRFEAVAESYKVNRFTITCEIESQLLSLETRYACYLVYKLPRKHSMVNGLLQIDNSWIYQGGSTGTAKMPEPQVVDLIATPHVPFIRDEFQIPPRTRKIKGHPKVRKDGWMEIQVWQFQTGTTHETIFLRSCFNFNHYASHDQWNYGGLVVQGIEFRPAKVAFSSWDPIEPS